MRVGKGLVSLVALACSLACGGPRSRVATPRVPERTSRVKLTSSGFTVGNGLKVVTVTEPEATQTSVTVRYGVGAKDDPAGKEGLAHVAEHLMFEQTYQGRTVMARLDEVATYANAFTRVDATTYVSRARSDRLADLLEIEGIRLGLRCETITDDVFARALEVVINERRQNAAAARVPEIVTDALIPTGHPYHRSVIGTETSLRSITRADACAFIDAHYAPANAVLVVSGPVSDADVDQALARMFGRIPWRAFTPSKPVPALSARPTQFTVDAPIDAENVVVAWPLPPEPGLRAKTIGVAAIAYGRVDSMVKGTVSVARWGGQGAEMYSLVIRKAPSESIDDVIAGVKRGLASTADWMSDDEFERSRQMIAFSTFTQLEAAEARDDRLAADMMIPGRTPGDGIASEISAAGTLTALEARSIAHEILGFERASVITLRPKDDRTGTTTSVQTTLHDSERRGPGDATGADAPAEFYAGANPLADARTRTLPNGLKVVLLPHSSVPTVEIRLVFGAGTADDRPGERGGAQLAATALAMRARDDRTLLQFFRAGGQLHTDVGLDATTFAVYGLDMYIDLLLTTLAREVRDGVYDDDQIDRIVDLARKQAKKSAGKRADQAAGAGAAAFRAALFGADHPYAGAGLEVDRIGAGTVAAFRKRYYQPGNASLIIAGGFDADLADAWIDFLLADWAGSAPARALERAHPTPAAIRIPEEQDPQLAVTIALPASARLPDRPAQLIAAAMLEEVCGDVRRQLSATYGVSVSLVEARQAAYFVLASKVDRERAVEALSLLRARIDEVRAGGAPVAAVFVAARRRVLEHLATPDTGASALAELVGGLAELGRGPAEEATLVDRVRDLTLTDMTQVLGTLDIARGVTYLRGPEADLGWVFAALGVEP